ncbi:GTPase IMAP family member 4-like isoform X2 [Salvelinus fontinalis]|uniref:GTPase IMAP family member 4-like isoform X2 n=1 Tax=Salvelinus fontinalis TaxID=8038 RepID=UPI0024868233|nr:GTPase IMAP family member 4-like isoform X2 [Salvelinus fontinalis]
MDSEEVMVEMEETGKSSDSQPGQAVPLSVVSGLRIILIGEREAGKSAVGNAILGSEVFDTVGVKTREAVKRQREVAERQVTVVDTPGWEWFPSRGSSLGVRREIVRGVSLCQPGPHAVLLVVPLSFSFTRRERQAAEEHVELLGERAWGHTVVLFTVKGGRLKDATLEEEVEESEELQCLVERCGGRYHALYGRSRKGHDAVAVLLEKLDNMVAKNRGELLSSEEVLEEAKEKEKEEERRHQEEDREREEDLRRVKEALRELEMEEETEEVQGDGGEATEESTRQQRGRRRYTDEKSDSVGSSSADPTSAPPHLTWSDLRAIRDQRCKTQ